LSDVTAQCLSAAVSSNVPEVSSISLANLVWVTFTKCRVPDSYALTTQRPW
jgi:hypothetical protein